MAITEGIFSEKANFADRNIDSLERMGELVEALKALDLKVVLTSGSYDLLHLGHIKYLEKAKECGDVLVVGVDNDEKIRERKGDDRPLVPEGERLEMLAYQRPVDLLYLKQSADPKWALIKTVQPDTLILSEDHEYSDRQMEDLQEFCGQITVLERQATVTTSERIRQMFMNLGERLGPQLAEMLPEMIEEIIKGNRRE